MLSRSISVNTKDLRRSRSTNTIYHRPSFTGLVVDPAVARQHALVAATIAYERSCEQGKEYAMHQQHSKNQQLLRRRSRSSRASGFEGEGSHFHEPFKTPKRERSTVKGKGSDHVKDASSHHARTRSGTLSSDVDAVDVSALVQARDFAGQGAMRSMPSVGSAAVRGDDRFGQHRSSISVHRLRKAKSMSSSSDEVGHAGMTSIDDISFAMPNHPPPLSPPLDDTRIMTIAELDIEDTVDIKDMATLPPRLTGTNLEGVPEQPLELSDLPPKTLTAQSLRNRASMILTPFKKRKGATPSPTPPPASSGHCTPTYANVVRHPGAVAILTPRFDRKGIASDAKKTGSIKAKIRSVFRRNSNPLRELPMQQVNASRAYFGQSSTLGSRNKENAGAVQSQLGKESHFLQLPLAVPRGESPAHSVVTVGTKSRVTSWADSTVAGTILEVDENHGNTQDIDGDGLESGITKKEDRFSSLNLLKRMRRMSKVDMRSSESNDATSEAEGSARATSRTSMFPPRKASGARDTLPSQLRKTTALPRSSIRAVPIQVDYNSITPVSEASDSAESVAAPSSHSTLRERNKLRKPSPLAMSAASPSPDQIAARVRRSEDRWQEPLQLEDRGRSLFFPRSPKRASLERHSRQTSEDPDSPSGVSQDNGFSDTGNTPRRAKNVVSPSVYSEDGVSPNLDALAELSALPPTPMPQPGTVLVQDVSRYRAGSASPPKSGAMEEPRKTSKEWRAWLDSLQVPLTLTEDDLQLKTQFTPRNPDSGHRSERAQIMDDESGDEVIGPKPCQDEENEEVATKRRDNQYAGGNHEDSVVEYTILRKPVTASASNAGRPKTLTEHRLARSIASSINTSGLPARTTEVYSDEIQQQEVMPSWTSPSTQTSTTARSRGMSYRLFQDDDRPSSRLHDIDEDSSRPSSRMNDRFPFMPSSRPQSRASGHSSTPGPSLRSRANRPTMVPKIESSISSQERDKENTAPSPLSHIPVATALRPRLVNTLRTSMSPAAMGRSTSALAQYTVNEEPSPMPYSPSALLPPTPIPQTQASLLPRPTSAYSSPTRQYATSAAATDVRVTKLQRRKHISMPSLETDPTLASILQGPYHKSPFTSPTQRVRRLTSSYVTSREGSPLKSNMELSPSTSIGSGQTPTGGQRLAEEFLIARRLGDEGGIMTSHRSVAIEGGFSPAFL